ncbi:dihydrodipicolinate synthase family protein [Gimesia maris]|uniref:dihydrodipicolinate synthase family protein n=1 Tax=Gimesia maris TaxID=122 RepID=UPI00241F2A0E|nr:dihydrodipicolinate synthase family protein [Gimesia maris]|tara:strand:+ start:10018 stop:10905 length:888 start_codon:yes stop_codon:yes gene_type:complete
MYEELFGIIPPLVTPFRADGSIDEGALRTETEYLIATAKVHGLAVCGSTGEGHTLSTEETRLITSVVIDTAAGRVPVITGIIANSTAAVIERGRAVRDLGVAALQVTPVHYVFRPNDDAMVRHFDEIAAATELPVMIYNVVPWTYLSPELLTRIIDEVEGVIGVKQSAGDMKLLADLLLMSGDRARIMSAVDALLYPSFALGAVGSIAAILTAAPTLCVELWDAVQAGNHKKGLELHEKLLPIWNAIFDDNLPANTRYCMELQGREGGIPRPPMPVTSIDQKGPIREALLNAGLI